MTSRDFSVKGRLKGLDVMPSRLDPGIEVIEDPGMQDDSDGDELLAMHAEQKQIEMVRPAGFEPAALGLEGRAKPYRIMADLGKTGSAFLRQVTPSLVAAYAEGDG